LYTTTTEMLTQSIPILNDAPSYRQQAPHFDRK